MAVSKHLLVAALTLSALLVGCAGPAEEPGTPGGAAAATAKPGATVSPPSPVATASWEPNGKPGVATPPNDGTPAPEAPSDQDSSSDSGEPKPTGAAKPSGDAKPSTAPKPAESPKPAKPSTKPSPEPSTAPWARFELGDGSTSWSMPAGWKARIESTVVQGKTDYEGFILDAAGKKMLRFQAVASGGQYATDFTSCSRPKTEVFERASLGKQVAGGKASVVALAHQGSDGSMVLSAGVSSNDPSTACEPGILALYGDGYDFLVLELTNDSGTGAPSFADLRGAKQYLESEEYRTIRKVLGSFERS